MRLAARILPKTPTARNRLPVDCELVCEDTGEVVEGVEVRELSFTSTGAYVYLRVQVRLELSADAITAGEGGEDGR